MALAHIQSFLDRFKNIAPRDAHIKRALCEIVQLRIGITIEPSALSVQNGIVYINAHGIMKSEIALQKKTILTELGERLGNETAVRDIR